MLDADTPCLDINQRSLDALLRQGLPVLATVLKTTDHEERVQVVRHAIVEAQHIGFHLDWIEEAVGGTAQDARREDWYSEEDAAQDRRQKTPFDGMDTPSRPPLAWVTYWRGEASNIFGPYVPGTYRRWGYVMWDGVRLETSGAMKYMALENRMDYYGDPREEDYLPEVRDA
jgi:hypothetical protein